MPIAQSNVRRPDILFESVLGTGTDVFFSCESRAKFRGAVVRSYAELQLMMVPLDSSSGMARRGWLFS